MSIKVEQVDAETVRVQVGERAYLIAAACPHRKGKMVFSRVNEQALRISCPLHYSTFDLRTGQVVSGPSCDPLRVVPVSPTP